MKQISTFFLIFYSLIMVANPFLEKYNTPYESVPFEKISVDDYLPAVKEGIRLELEEIDKITQNPETPTFRNTILALEECGKTLNKVTSVYFNLIIANTNDEMEAISEEITKLTSDLSNKILQNKALFERIKYVYEHELESLTGEDKKLVEESYKSYIRSGALLNDKDKKKFAKLNEELSSLTLKFGQNTIKDKAEFVLHVTNKDDVKGIPDYALDAAHSLAKEKGKEGWIFTLYQPSYVPFMRYAENRELREKMYMAYNTQGFKNNKFNNEKILQNIVNKRLERAKLLRYNTYADYALENRMAQKSENVYHLLDQLLEAYKPTAIKEYNDLQTFANKLGLNDTLQPWDWSFYSNKLKEEKYGFNEQELRPYFEVNQVIKGVFGLAEKLYGLSFEKTTNISVYQDDVEVFKVNDENGHYLALLYVDFYARNGKQGGAWMTDFKEQSGDTRPHVSLVMNFQRPVGNNPSLLTLDEVETFTHEFGHAMHSMLSQCRYQSLAGTNVYRDFVELPSQLMENWCTEKEFLDSFAFHYQTGEKISEDLIDKLKRAKNFNVAYACLRQLSFGYLDMAWHTLTEPFKGDIESFENNAWKKTQILPIVNGTCMSTNFNHLFSGGYAAGYYSYKWAEVLDADAFSVFKANGIFNKTTANSFRKNILERGGTEHPMDLYKRFRGQEPSIDGLLKRDGIK